MKTCVKCGKAQPLTEFYRQATMKDGYRNDCKACMKVMRRSWYERNRDCAIQRTQKWREAHPERYAE